MYQGGEPPSQGGCVGFDSRRLHQLDLAKLDLGCYPRGMAVSISYNGDNIGSGPSLPREGYRVDGNGFATLKFDFLVMTHPVITGFDRAAMWKWLNGNLPLTLRDDEHGVWVDCYLLQVRDFFTLDDPRAHILLERPIFAYREPIGYLPMP